MQPSDADLGIPADAVSWSKRVLPMDLPGHRVPPLVLITNLSDADLDKNAVALPEANTLAHVHLAARLVGQFGHTYFNPQTVLVKFKGRPLVSALRVESWREWDAVQLLRQRKDVEFAELDVFERRQFTPNDPLLNKQWHHAVIGSAQAWNTSLGTANVRIAIVDTPFQMNHPDLIANTASGWDVDANQPVTNGAGISHSTLCAGMAAAVVNNGIGVAGAANCKLVPINIIGSLSDMYNATIWAATNGIRVVNISWSGGTDPTLEAAGLFLKTNAGGILVMSAIDGYGTENGPNQPDVYCVSMTDAADNVQATLSGPYIDFAAPGFQVYSTTTNSSYAYGTGCSFAAPLVAGVIGWMFSLNPTLGSGDVIGILTNTATQIGSSDYYGWGRINFGAAAAATVATLPNITSATITTNGIIVTANYRPGVNYHLLRTFDLNSPTWNIVSSVTTVTNGTSISLIDNSLTASNAYYRVEAH